MTWRRFGLFLYGLIRGLAVILSFGEAFNHSVKLLDRPGLALEASFRLGCGVMAGIVAYGLSAWIAKPLVPEMSKKWWAPWAYESGYGLDAFIVIVGLLCAFVTMAIATSVGVVSIK